MSKVALKYKNALSELENAIMKPNFKDINLAAFFKEHKLDTTLMTIFIRDKVFTKLGSGLYANNKPHEIQKLARSPSTAVRMIQEYKTALKWKRSDTIERILIKDETDKDVPSDEEIAIVTSEQIEDSKAVKTYGEEVVRRADEAFDQDVSEMTKAYVKLFSGVQYAAQSTLKVCFGEESTTAFNTEHLITRVENVIKKDVYTKYLERAKESLDAEFEQFRKWKEEQNVKD